MELRLETSDVKQIILEWATLHFPRQFDTVEINSSYSSNGYIVLTKEEVDVTDTDA